MAKSTTQPQQQLSNSFICLDCFRWAILRDVFEPLLSPSVAILLFNFRLLQESAFFFRCYLMDISHYSQCDLQLNEFTKNENKFDLILSFVRSFSRSFVHLLTHNTHITHNKSTIPHCKTHASNDMSTECALDSVRRNDW